MAKQIGPSIGNYPNQQLEPEEGLDLVCGDDTLNDEVEDLTGDPEDYIPEFYLDLSE